MSLPKSLKIVKDILENSLPFDSFEKPIFIISPPRSGSTFLFDCLVQFKELFHISYEADLIWWKHFPYSRLSQPSDYIGENEASDYNIHAFKRSLRARASMNMLKNDKRWSHVPSHLGLKPINYIDKTISNCFHLDFINKAFPDAQYIFLLRDPRAVISSMMEGWDHKFQKPQLQEIISNVAGHTVKNWSYPAAPGWDGVITESLENICAWSWAKHIEYPLSFFQRNNVGYHTIKYEDLVKNTATEVKKIAGIFDLQINDKVNDYLSAPQLSSTTVSKPSQDKWKQKNKKQVENILPRIEGLAKKIGYDI